MGCNGGLVTDFYISDTSGGGVYPGVGASVRAVTDDTTGAYTGLSFLVQRTGVSLFELMHLTSGAVSGGNGGVGIGVSSPKYRLDVLY